MQTGAATAGALVEPAARPELPRAPQFGSWLDDASTWSAGSGSTGIGIGYWRGSGVNQIDAPILTVNYGVTNRAQFGAMVPFYRVSYRGTTERGLDDVYLNGKFSIVDPAASGRFGLAVGTVLEILSFAPDEETSRVQWAVPISMEMRGNAVRVYGSTGYFSRGAAFGAGAIEWTSSGGTSLTASLAHSASVRDRALTAGASNLTDISLYVGHPVADAVSVYGGVGQTFTGGTQSLSLSAGVSFSFAR